MKTIAPRRTTVASFSSSSPAAKAHHQQQQGFEYDSGEYILSVASPVDASLPSSSHDDASRDASSCCAVAAALSDRSIVLYDRNAGRITRRMERAHDGPISDIHFFPREYDPQSQLLISSSHDGTVKVWDARVKSGNDRCAMAMRLALPEEQALSVSLGYGGTLAAVGTSKARVSFFDLRHAMANGSDKPSGSLMGSYVDAHTEEVTRVRFQTVPHPQSQSSSSGAKTVLATASEDGLIALHDPSRPSEEDALLSVINVGAPLRDAGFFGPCLEGMYALTGNETLSVHHWDSAQRVSDVGGMGLRGLLSRAVDEISDNGGGSVMLGGDNGGGASSVEYLAGCIWSQLPSEASPALHLLAGNSGGDGYLFKIDADRITPMVHLKGGHRGCIRDFCWIDGRLVTGGEDARLCEWDLFGSSNNDATSFGSSSGKVARPLSGRLMKTANIDAGGGRKGKKKSNSPY